MDKKFSVLFKDIRYDNLQLENRPWRPALAYIIFGVLWIVFSDKILSLLVTDLETYGRMQTYKGWFYVLVTGLLLYVLVKLDNRRLFEMTRLIAKKNEDLVSFSEELIAMEEELEKKLHELNAITSDLKHQSEFNDELFNSSNTAIWVYKFTGENVNCNRFCTEKLGWKPNEKDVYWANYLSDKDAVELEDILNTVSDFGAVIGMELEFQGIDGESMILLCNMTKIVDPATREVVIVSFGTDITTERMNEKRLLELATTDPLTKLTNRAAFMNDVIGYFESGKRIAFFLIGLDNFKYLNDLYGHGYGDALLVKLSEALKSNFDKACIYRWSGDEFLVMREAKSDQDVDDMARDILALAKKKWEIRDIIYRSSASVGVVLYPDNGDDPKQIVANLDLALSYAKRSGKGQYQYVTDKFVEALQYEATMEKALKEAIADDRLKLVGQPIVNMLTGELESVEILLRWPNNPLSENNIGKVISLAEKTGLIISVDKWVIEDTFKTMRQYAGQMKSLKFAVNISVQSFHSRGFIDFLQSRLQLYKIDPKQVELEITEYSLVKDIDKSLEIIDQIKALGVSIALDDFGTKFSSLNYLSKLPFDVLKIDKSYIDQIINEPKDKAIVKSLVNLSKDLGLSTVVEGIEIMEQRDMVVEMGCVYGQGYLFSKPKPIESIFTEFNI